MNPFTRTRLLWMLAVGASLSGCYEQVEFIASYGFCEGLCVTAVKLNRRAIGTIEYSSRRGDRPTVIKSLSLPERASELKAAVDEACAIRWEDRYGCPDCADQGRYDLTAHCAEEVRSTTLDPAGPPDAFARIVAFFDRVRSENPVPEE